jgi:hypothetical protein
MEGAEEEPCRTLPSFPSLEAAELRDFSWALPFCEAELDSLAMNSFLE